MKNLAIFLALLLCAASNATAQSITITSLSGTVFCSGDSVDVGYSATGTFTNRNSFTVQLSDQAGSFDKYFYNLGSKRTTTSGTIRIGVPELEPGTLYRIRAISSEPYVVSNVHPSVLSLGPKPKAWATIGGPFEGGLFALMLNDTVRFLNQSTNASTYLWEFGPDAVPPTSTENDPVVRFTTPGVKRVALTATSAYGCSDTWVTDGERISLSKPYIVVVSCFPSIPSLAKVDSTPAYESYHGIKGVWVVPGGVVGGSSEGVEYYVEPGGTVQYENTNDIYYLKAGAAYFGHGRRAAVVFEDGAGMQGTTRQQLLKCADLEFDYSDAPPYKINPSSVSRLSGSTIQVYPNPTTDRLWVEHKDNIIREISIRNSLGAEQLFVQPEGLGKTSIDVSHLAAGLYFLDLITDKGIETHKIVVQ